MATLCVLRLFRRRQLYIRVRTCGVCRTDLHIVALIAVHEGREIFAFTRPGDFEAQQFALRLGAAWAGGSVGRPPVELDAALFSPAALAACGKGGVVVSGGIDKSDLPSFTCRLFWHE